MIEIEQYLLERIRRHILFAEYTLPRFERLQQAVVLANEICRLLPPDRIIPPDVEKVGVEING